MGEQENASLGFWFALASWSIVVHVLVVALWMMLQSQQRSGGTPPLSFVPVDFIIVDSVETPIRNQPLTTSSPQNSPTPSPNNSPSPSPTSKPSPTPTPSPSPSPTATPTPSPSPTTTPTPSPSPTATPTPSPSPTATPTPSPSPTATPTPSPSPTTTPTPSPSPTQTGPGTGETGGETDPEEKTGSFVVTLGTPRLQDPDRDVPTQPAQVTQTRQTLSVSQYLEPLGLSGDITVEVEVVVMIDAEGKATVYPDTAQILSGDITPRQGGQLAKQVIEQWSFTPSYMEGSPINQEYVIQLRTQTL